MHFSSVYIALGSNLGNRVDYLYQSCDCLNRHLGAIVRQSGCYQTAPWGDTAQPFFLNQVVLIKTEMTPFEILEKTQWIEAKLGRVRHKKWGARTIDLDILYLNQAVLNSEQLTLPHPLIQDRPFVLNPLVEIAPHFEHPVLKKTNLQMLEALSV